MKKLFLLCLLLCLLLIFTISENVQSEETKSPLSMFRGTIEDVSYTKGTDSPQPDRLNPADMARRALVYLNGNPMPEHNWQCQFSLGPLGVPCMIPIVPANQYGVDPVSLGDTDLRMQLQFSHMKEMAGIKEVTPAELGVKKLVRAYLKDDGICWVNPSAMTGKIEEGLWGSSWTMQFELRSLCDEYRLNHSQAVYDSAKKLVAGMKIMAQWDGPNAWLTIGPWRNGTILRNGWCQQHARQYTQSLVSLVDYMITFKDKDALPLACAFADGIIAEYPKDLNELKVNSKSGQFHGHVHLHTNVFWGMAHLGEFIGEKKYTDWAQLACEAVWKNGTDYGWIPEHMPSGNTNEVCVLGDVVPAATYLAKTVGPFWYDRIELIVRNTLARSQFEVNTEFEKLFRSLHKDMSEDALAKALQEVRRLEGGFVSQTRMTGDWVAFPANMGAPGMYKNGIQMMGCCPPSGMHALWAWWNAAIEERKDGVFVNFALTRDSVLGRLKSYSAADGRLDIACKKEGTWYLRVPGWTNRDKIRLLVNGKEVKPLMGGPDSAYVVVKEVKKGDELSLRWQVPVFSQTISYHGKTIKIRWTGSEVTAMTRTEPVLLPMYSPY